jgi:hypothetical protein
LKPRRQSNFDRAIAERPFLDQVEERNAKPR